MSDARLLKPGKHGAENVAGNINRARSVAELPVEGQERKLLIEELGWGFLQQKVLGGRQSTGRR
jgi:hypothetical protein